MTTSSKKATVSAVAIASYEFTGATETIVAAIKAAAKAGVEAQQIAVEFRAGRIARAIVKGTNGKVTEAQRNAAIAKGTDIVLACEPGRKAKQGQRHRTEAEQALFEPTKRWWSRMGRDAGVIKPRAAAPRTGKGKTKKGSKAKGPYVVKTPKDSNAALLSVQNMLHMLATYCAKHVKLLPADVTAKCNRTSVEVDEIAKAM